VTFSFISEIYKLEKRDGKKCFDANKAVCCLVEEVFLCSVSKIGFGFAHFPLNPFSLTFKYSPCLSLII